MAHPVDTLVDMAVAAQTPLQFQIGAMAELRRWLGFDNALFRPGSSWSGSEAVYLESGARFTDIYTHAPHRYRDELASWCEASRGSEAFLFEQMYSTHDRSSMATESEVLRPAGIRGLMGCPLRFGGSTVGLLFLFRHGRGSPFTTDASARVTRLLPALALAQAAMLSRPAATPPAEPPASPPLRGLTPREAQIAELVARGLTSKEISSVTGTSFHTVRKQTLAVYQRLGVRNRAGLAALITRMRRAPWALALALAPAPARGRHQRSRRRA